MDTDSSRMLDEDQRTYVKPYLFFTCDVIRSELSMFD